MKTLCLFLICCITLLSVKPCCTDTDCDAQQTITTATNSTPNDQDDCSGCPPFFACGACAGMVLAKPLSYSLLNFPEPTLKHIAIYQHPFVEDVLLVIWQPPKLG